MSLRTASPAVLRAGARALRTGAARVGLGAWRTAQCRGAVQQWKGFHADAWRGRALQVGAAARALEALLRRLATEVERYALAVEAAQERLDALDAEADALPGRVARDLALWEAVQGPGRGARPDLVLALVAVEERRRQLEDEAEADAEGFARRVDALLATLAAGPSAESVLRAVLDSPAYAYGHALPSGLAGVGGAAAGAVGRQLPVLPRGVRLPLGAVGAVGGPLGAVGDVLTLTAPEAPGVRDDMDQVAAGAGLFSAAGGVLLAITSVVTGVAAAPFVGGVLTAVGGTAALYGVVMLFADAVTGRTVGEGRPTAPATSGVRTPRATRDPLAPRVAGPPVPPPQPAPLPVGRATGLGPVGPAAATGGRAAPARTAARRRAGAG